MNILDVALSNKYTNWYSSLMKKAQSRAKTRKEAKILLGYVEGHHILPRCIMPNKKIVYLTAREHFIAHHLLTKMFDSPLYKQKNVLCHGSVHVCELKNAATIICSAI